MMPLYRSLCLLSLGSAMLSCGASADTTNHQDPQLERDLDMVGDFSIVLDSASLYGDHGVMLNFTHGAGGTPIHKIYGMQSFHPNAELDGETCRSAGGQWQEFPTGMAILQPNPLPTERVLAIDVDMANLAEIFWKADGDKTVIRYCVYFALQTADGWDANFVETEVRLVISQDGTITIDSLGNGLGISQPLTRDFTKTFGLTASVCNVPAQQGDVASICIECTDDLVSIVSVDWFKFIGSETEQSAFVGGAVQSLTEIAQQDAHFLQFNTLLVAEFYMAADKTVRGEGLCTLSNGERRMLQLRVPDEGSTPGPTLGEYQRTPFGPDSLSGTANQRTIASTEAIVSISDEEESEGEDVSVSLAFIIGQEPVEEADSHRTGDVFLREPPSESDDEEPSTTTGSHSHSAILAIALVTSLLASIASFLGVTLVFRYGRKGLSPNKMDESSCRTEDSTSRTDAVEEVIVEQTRPDSPFEEVVVV